MFEDAKVFSGFAVPDIGAAKDFYEGKLGLNVTAEHGMLWLHVGSDRILVYPKPDHEPANFTILNFPVSDVDAAVEKLKGKGVTFESYDFPDLKTDEKDIFRDGGPDIAWFKDPAGNIFSVIEDVGS